MKNKFLLIISLIPSFFSLSLLAMETDVTENIYIETADKITHAIKIGSEALRRLQAYDIFKKAKEIGKQDDPKILSTIKSFQLALLEQTEFIYIKSFGSKEITKLPVLSPLFSMSEFFGRMFTGEFTKYGITKAKPLRLNQIDSTQLKLVVESVKNIANLSTYLADKDVNQISLLLSAASFLDIKEIMPDIILRLSHFIQSVDDFDTWPVSVIAEIFFCTLIAPISMYNCKAIPKSSSLILLP